jgi:hypothetical protein
MRHAVNLRNKLINYPYNKMIKRLLSKRIEHRFTDIVNGRGVYLYECKDGTRFLAHSKLDSLFFYVKQ